MTTRRKRTTRAAIMDSALELFTAHGYEAVRVEDVAREAGVSRATFYNHFSEREEVLGALFQRLLATELPDHTRTNVPPLEQIEHVAIEAARGMLDQPQLARFIYSLPVRHEALLKPDDESTPAVFRTIHHLLEIAHSHGELRTDVPVELMCVHVHNSLEAAMRAWADGLTDDPIERVRVLVRLSLYGVVAEPAGGTSRLPVRSEIV